MNLQHGTCISFGTAKNYNVFIFEDINFAQEINYLTRLSMDLANMRVNRTVRNNYGSVVFSGTNNSLNVFSISQDILKSSYSLDVDVSNDSKILINVTGIGEASLQNKGMGARMEKNEQYLIFIFPEQTKLMIHSYPYPNAYEYTYKQTHAASNIP